jgi:hypothetical protein
VTPLARKSVHLAIYFGGGDPRAARGSVPVNSPDDKVTARCGPQATTITAGRPREAPDNPQRKHRFVEVG